MKKIVALVLLISSLAASAGTVYRDRYVPAGVPCIVPFNGSLINATMIQDISVGTFTITTYNRDGKIWTDTYIYRNYQALRVSMINNTWYEMSSDDTKLLEANKTSFLLLLKAECGTVK